jgi:biopolymer transport protein ExbD
VAFNNFEEDQEEVTPEINMTPLIDIMLVLLIIFMVTSSVSNESGISVDLPSTSDQSKIAKNDNEGVIVTLDKVGNIYIQGHKVEKNIKELLQTEIAKSKSKTVIFEGDKKATLGEAIRIIDIAKQVGAKQFAIATQEK